MCCNTIKTCRWLSCLRLVTSRKCGVFAASNFACKSISSPAHEHSVLFIAFLSSHRLTGLGYTFDLIKLYNHITGHRNTLKSTGIHSSFPIFLLFHFFSFSFQRCEMQFHIFWSQNQPSFMMVCFTVIPLECRSRSDNFVYYFYWTCTLITSD